MDKDNKTVENNLEKNLVDKSHKKIEEEPKKYKVDLYLYDLSNGMARTMSPLLLGKQIDAIYHSGLVVYGIEYFFGGGICRGYPAVRNYYYNKYLYQSTPYGYPILKLENYGETEVDQELFESYISSIDSEFQPENYNLINHNCNHFTENVCSFLTGKSIPDYVLNQIDGIKDTQLGKAFLPMLEKMGQQSIPNMYEKK